MAARFYADLPLAPGMSFALPDQAARHVQVLRLQPGGLITLFNGKSLNANDQGEGEFEATVTRMGRSDVEVMVGAYTPTAREAIRTIHLVLGMPANERMDWLIEKATELGVASIQPLISERTVLRLKGERAEKKLAHWRGIAIAACEQCGRNRLPFIHEVASLADWIKDKEGQRTQSPMTPGTRLLLSLRGSSQALGQAASATAPLTFLSGPEGGLSTAEEDIAINAGFTPVTLGARILRAETAPLAVLAKLNT